MAQEILVDTDILIDVGRGIPVAVDRLGKDAKIATLAISIITQMELIVGCRNKTELQALEQFLRHYTIIKIDKFVSDKAVELIRNYRLSHGLLLPDAFIAATAIVRNIPLLTKNQRDYRFISGFNLLSYP